MIAASSLVVGECLCLWGFTAPRVSRSRGCDGHQQELVVVADGLLMGAAHRLAQPDRGPFQRNRFFPLLEHRVHACIERAEAAATSRGPQRDRETRAPSHQMSTAGGGGRLGGGAAP